MACSVYFQLELREIIYNSGGEFFLGLLLSLLSMIGYCIISKSFRKGKRNKNTESARPNPHRDEIG